MNINELKELKCDKKCVVEMNFKLAVKNSLL